MHHPYMPIHPYFLIFSKLKGGAIWSVLGFSVTVDACSNSKNYVLVGGKDDGFLGPRPAINKSPSDRSLMETHGII